MSGSRGLVEGFVKLLQGVLRLVFFWGKQGSLGL